MKIVKSVIYVENSTYTVGQIENVIPGITSLHFEQPVTVKSDTMLNGLP